MKMFTAISKCLLSLLLCVLLKYSMATVIYELFCLSKNFEQPNVLVHFYFKSLLEMEEYEPWRTKPDNENVVVEIKSATFGWNEVLLLLCICIFTALSIVL